MANDGGRFGRFAGWRSIGQWFSKAGGYLLPGGGGRVRLEERLRQAGLYAPGAAQIYLGAGVILAVGLTAIVLILLPLVVSVTAKDLLLAGLIAAGIGLLTPSFWLARRTNWYQGNLRRAIPDALDLLVLCVEGGVSLGSAIQRVTEDLQMAHPLLAAEFTIVQREMQMGISAGEAIKLFGKRCGLPEVKDLASVVLQSEQYGAGVAKTLRLHSDTCRSDRQQRAEEMAQKAGVKILFPTLLCIFPAVFIVLLGPAAYQMADVFSKTR
jgi:tight adherence protein C